MSKTEHIPMPCPFCGAIPHIVLSKVKYDQLHGDPYQDTIVKCPHLCAYKTGCDKQSAIQRWNTRKDGKQQSIAELVDIVERLQDIIHWTYCETDADEPDCCPLCIDARALITKHKAKP